jgi:hypothetical protein
MLPDKVATYSSLQLNNILKLEEFFLSLEDSSKKEWIRMITNKQAP